MKSLVTSEEFPPNIEEIREAFDLSGDELFCYGEVIYNPSKKTLTPDLINHEMVHAEQMHGQIEKWWKLYLKDPVFRASQEIPAYQVQYATAKKYIKDRNRLHAYAVVLAKNLSGATYGNAMTFHDALSQIKAEKLFDVRSLAK